MSFYGQIKTLALTLFKIGFFGAAHGWQAKKTFSLKSVAYPTVMKLDSYSLPKEDPKNI